MKIKKLVELGKSVCMLSAASVFGGSLAGQARAQSMTVIRGDGNSVVSNGGGTIVINDKTVSPGAGPYVQGKGEMREKTLELASFSKIRLDDAIDVVFVQGPTSQMRLMAQENILPLLKPTVKGGQLRIEMVTGFSTDKRVKAYVSSPSLIAIEINGSGDLSASKLSGTSLAVDIAGSGDVSVKGTVDTMKVRIAGSGDVDASEVIARSLVVQVSGSGDVRGYASGEARVRVNGSGDVRVYGNPATKFAESNGSGKIRFP